MGGVEVKFHPFVNSGLDGGEKSDLREWSNSRLDSFTPETVLTKQVGF